MTGMTEGPVDPWDGVDRRSTPALAPETIEALTKTHESMAAVAQAMIGLTDALTGSVLRQGRGTRNWLIALTLSTLLSFGLVVFLTLGNRQQGQRNFAQVAYVASCVEVGGQCFEEIAKQNKVVTDADRKLLAQEIVCFAFEMCPPGMTPENIPDLEGLEPLEPEMEQP